MFTKLASFYTEKYPTDELGKEINSDSTFRDLYASIANGVDVYIIMGVSDSMIRERLFSHLCSLLNVEYNHIYELWLNNVK